MKIRNGFVSNSSSSSFLIPRKYVSDYQLELIQEHIPLKECQKPGRCGEFISGEGYSTSCDACDEGAQRWSISETFDGIEGYTTMDNFDMNEYLEKIGVPMDHVIWEHS